MKKATPLPMVRVYLNGKLAWESTTISGGMLQDLRQCAQINQSLADAFGQIAGRLDVLTQCHSSMCAHQRLARPRKGLAYQKSSRL